MAQRHLTKAVETTSSIYKRLSSGARINHASDDAAGLAISSSLKVNSRIFTQGIKNLHDAAGFDGNGTNDLVGGTRD